MSNNFNVKIQFSTFSNIIQKMFLKSKIVLNVPINLNNFPMTFIGKIFEKCLFFTIKSFEKTRV